jgi:motility quorum-sensing regulator/GCU-specific mRNA interferase toxin
VVSSGDGNNEAHHRLEDIKAALTDRNQPIRTDALRNAFTLGFDRAEIVATIQTIQPSQFYKSMTSYHDRRVGQDV